MSWKTFLTKIKTTPAFMPLVLILLFVLLVLSGCATKPPPNPNLNPTTLTKVEYVAYVCGQPPGSTHVTFDSVEFRLIPVDGTVVWTLTAQEYSDLGNNVSDILQAVKETNGERDFWKKCVEDSLARLVKLNEAP